jgi:hypothetical protein
VPRVLESDLSALPCLVCVEFVPSRDFDNAARACGPLVAARAAAIRTINTRLRTNFEACTATTATATDELGSLLERAGELCQSPISDVEAHAHANVKIAAARKKRSAPPTGDALAPPLDAKQCAAVARELETRFAAAHAVARSVPQLDDDADSNWRVVPGDAGTEDAGVLFVDVDGFHWHLHAETDAGESAVAAFGQLARLVTRVWFTMQTFRVEQRSAAAATLLREARCT